MLGSASVHMYSSTAFQVASMKELVLLKETNRRMEATIPLVKRGLAKMEQEENKETLMEGH